MAEIINLAIETAINEKRINLLTFTEANPNLEYYELYKEHLVDHVVRNPMISSVDLSRITDEKLLMRVVGFMWYSMNPKRRSAKGYHFGTVLGLISLLNHIDVDSLSNYPKFLLNASNVTEPNYKRIACWWVHRFIRYCEQEDNVDNPYRADIWRLDKMKLAPERINVSRNNKKIYFTGILDCTNKILIKRFAKHLLLNTDNAISSVVAKLNVIANTLNASGIAYNKWTKDIAEKVILDRKNKVAPRTLAKQVMHLEEFTEFLIIHDVISDSPIKQFHEMTLAEYKYKETSSDKYVLTQIFNVLGDVSDKSLVLCFLVIYCTGMRVSEACQLKKNCLEKYKNTYFIRFYQTKMKKDVTNVIPKALYEMIEDYRLSVPEEVEYLFYSKQINKPKQSSTFTSKFAKELEQLGVKNSDGTLYRFTAHSFRHLMAVKMREADIPFQYIVEQLHHESPEMTLAYLEFLNRQKISKMKKFVNAHGDETPITAEIQQNLDEDYAEYMRKFINAQMLPDGVCARPVKLGKCKHCNACLFCEDFRTSSDFMESHKEHLQRVISYIDLAKQNGWEIQEKQAKETKRLLTILIKKLEKEDE